MALAALAWLARRAGIRPARTVIAWQHQRFRNYWRQLSPHRKPGREGIPVSKRREADLFTVLLDRFSE